MDFEKYLKEHGQECQFRQGEHVFRQGENNGALYLIRKGLLKAYYLSAGGREQVKSFLMPGNIIGNLVAAYADQPNSFSLVCLDECELVKFSFDDMRRLSREDASVSERMTELLLSLAMKKERREFELLCLSAEERYRLLLERSPELLQKVTQQDIALYLGITPVGLSRIKKRISNEEELR